MTLLLQYTLIFASVLLMVALGGCFAERSGVVIEIEKEVFVWCVSRRVLWCIFMKKRRYGGNRQKKDFPVVEISEKTRIRHLSCSGREKLSKMLVIGGEICQ